MGVENDLKEFIIRYPEEELECILAKLEGTFTESGKRRVRVGNEYIVAITYIGKKGCAPTGILEENGIRYEKNRDVYKTDVKKE